MGATPFVNPQDAVADKAPARSQDRHLLDPPAAQYVRTDDLIIIDYFQSTSISAMFISYRLMNTKGEIVELSQRVQTPTFNAFAVATVPLNEGYLLGVTFGGLGLNASIPRGTFFATISIGRRIGAGVFARCICLASDYATGLSMLAWPGGTIRQPSDGAGNVTTIGLSNPAAGLELSFTNVNQKRWRLKYGAFTLTTSAVVANRQVGIVLITAGTTMFSYQRTVAQVASQVKSYRVIPGLQAEVVGNSEVLIPAPADFLFTPNAQFKTLTAGLDAGDQYSVGTGVVEEWLDL